MRRVWIVTAIMSMIVLGLLAVLSKISDQVGIDQVMRDAQATTGGSPLIALGSDLGMYCWVAAISIGLFSLAIAFKRGGAPAGDTRYLVAILALTLVMLSDDRMMFHEYFFPQMWGVEQTWVVFGIACLGVVFLIAGWNRHHLGGWPILLTSGGLLLASLLFDEVEPLSWMPLTAGTALSLHYLLEDGLKLAGLLFWLVFVSRVGLHLIESAGQLGEKEAGGSAGPLSA